MIDRLIDVALKNRFIVIALYLALAVWGWWALGATPIDSEEVDWVSPNGGRMTITRDRCKFDPVPPNWLY